MSYSDAIDGSIETFSRAIKRMLSGARGKQMVFLSMSIPPQHKMRSSLRKDTLVKNNWMFRNVHALPPAIRYYLSLSPSYMFSDSHVTFMEWLTEQFPRGRGL